MAFESLFTIVDTSVLDRFSSGTNGAGRHDRKIAKTLLLYQYILSDLYLKHCFGTCTGISFIDSSSLKVCHNRRIQRRKVFRGLAARGKTAVDWFFGFKLHLVVNDQGELLNIQITPGNTDDRKPVAALLKDLDGKVFVDRG